VKTPVPTEYPQRPANVPVTEGISAPSIGQRAALERGGAPAWLEGPVAELAARVLAGQAAAGQALGERAPAGPVRVRLCVGALAGPARVLVERAPTAVHVRVAVRVQAAAVAAGPVCPNASAVAAPVPVAPKRRVVPGQGYGRQGPSAEYRLGPLPEDGRSVFAQASPASCRPPAVYLREPAPAWVR